MLFRIIILSIFFLPPFWGSNVLAADTEKIFEEAANYTVKINARIQDAFIEDEPGSTEGAGFVVDIDRGWIITNAHIVGWSPSKVTVTFIDGSTAKARKIYVDPSTHRDIAVLAINKNSAPDDLVAAPLDCDQWPATGHPVGAYGHPYGFEYTGTQGIISGISEEDSSLLVDAAINPGNSGGPLLSLDTGKVVGINTSSVDDEYDQNTNFSDPIFFSCDILDLLRDGIDPSPPKFPVMFLGQSLIVAKNNLSKEALDLKPDDEIMGVKGYDGSIYNLSDLFYALRGNYENFTLIIRRGDNEIEIPGHLQPEPLVIDRKGIKFSGILIGRGPIFDNSEIIKAEKLPVIHKVAPGSLAEENGFQADNIILAVDGRQYTNLQILYDYLDKRLKEKQSVTFKMVTKSSSDWAFFDYGKSELEIENLEMISAR